MALSQIKLISAGLTAAGLLAGGLGAGAWALGSPGAGPQETTSAPVQKPAVKAVAKPSNIDFVPKTTLPTAGASPSPGVETRLDDLERKLDLLLQRLNPPPPGLDALLHSAGYRQGLLKGCLLTLGRARLSWTDPLRLSLHHGLTPARLRLPTASLGPPCLRRGLSTNRLRLIHALAVRLTTISPRLA